MYIKDLQSGEVRKYGSNHHDSLCVSRDGTTLSYYNLQNGDGSRFGDYRFCDENGLTPEEDEVLMRYGAEAYFNIGGFIEVVRCRDCKWFGDVGCAIMIADDSDKPTEDDYCSFAERKDGESDDDS